MSYYYKYNFISPEPIYAIVSEELKSYMDTGAIDNLLFPSYVDKCLRKLGRSSYVITQDILYVENYEARLPDNFYAVREAWMCTEVHNTSYQTANSFYSQTASTTVQVSPFISGEEGHSHEMNDEMPDVIEAVYKTNYQKVMSYKREMLLKPGNISAKRDCDVEYIDEGILDNPHSNMLHNFSMGSSSYDSFDIHDNKFVTNFKDAVIHLVFYSHEYDNVGNQMIPDNYRIREYIEAFLRYKMFELLVNQTNDETFKQLQEKLVYYKQLCDESYIMADMEIKKSTVYQKQRKIKETLNRFNMYELPHRNNFYGRRRNN